MLNVQNWENSLEACALEVVASMSFIGCQEWFLGKLKVEEIIWGVVSG